MNINQFVKDTIEVTEYILSRLNRKQLYLLGHSWGTIIGMLAIKHTPQLYKRYFGISQVTDFTYSERFSYNKLLERAKTEKNTKAYDTIYQIGQPPWNDINHK